MATSSGFWQDFRHWRRRRPFWGGLLLLIAGLELFLSANLSLGDMQVHIGPQGFLSYLLPLMLLLCGLLSWFTPAQRLFYGILGLLTALYSMIGLNFGGFFAGMLIGIFGGALVISWGPPRRRPDAAPATAESGPASDAPDETGLAAADDAPTEFLPGFSEPLRASQPSAPTPTADGEAPPPPSGGSHRKAFVIVFVPLVVVAAVLVGGSHTPARADTCPEGLPSRSTTTSASSSKNAAKSSSSASAKKTATAKKSATGSAKASAKASSSASAAAADDEESDSSVLDQIKDGVTDIVDGIADLLGIGDDATPSASPSPSTSSSAADPTPSTPASASDKPSASATAEPSGSSSSSGSASPSPTPTSTDIPCLGARVFGLTASPDDLPIVSDKGGTLETDSLTMYNSTYDGVATLRTVSGGTVKALKFSMTKAVNKPFKLTIPEKDSHTTLIESNELTTDGNVKFYTPSFKGKLFGLIPVTFTPEQPPPLTLPVLWFTDVTINLAFVRCDTLTADPLKLTEPS